MLPCSIKTSRGKQTNKQTPKKYVSYIIIIALRKYNFFHTRIKYVRK